MKHTVGSVLSTITKIGIDDVHENCYFQTGIRLMYRWLKEENLPILQPNLASTLAEAIHTGESTFCPNQPSAVLKATPLWSIENGMIYSVDIAVIDADSLKPFKSFPHNTPVTVIEGLKVAHLFCIGDSSGKMCENFLVGLDCIAAYFAILNQDKLL